MNPMHFVYNQGQGTNSEKDTGAEITTNTTAEWTRNAQRNGTVHCDTYKIKRAGPLGRRTTPQAEGHGSSSDPSATPTTPPA